MDVDGNTFLDFTAGFAVAALGHGAAVACEAAIEMFRRPMIHAMGDAFADESRIALLEELAAFVPQLPKGILGCSGSDAVQAALKTAVLSSGRAGVLAFSGGYHGLSHGSLAPTAYKQADFREPFSQQLGSHVTFAEFGALPLPPLASLGIGAVLLEPIQGRGGVRPATRAWLNAVRAHCDTEGALLIYDEIYTGFGRTGHWFAYEGATDADDGDGDGESDAVGAPLPDLLCVGKALGGGFPISVCLGTAEAMDAWGASQGEALHTQTFLGNPVGCAMALASLRELKRIGAPALARRNGKTLRRLLKAHGVDGAVRGRGLMLAVSVQDPLHAMAALLREGVIALPCGEGADSFSLALIPPLTVTDAQMEYVVAAVARVCADRAAM